MNRPYVELRAGMTKTWTSAADVEAVLPQTLVVYDMGGQALRCTGPPYYHRSPHAAPGKGRQNG